MILAIIQARMTSTRLPGKVMKEVLGRPLIWYLLKRMQLSKKINKCVVATSTDSRNDGMCEYLADNGFEVFRGEEDDVLDRFYQTAQKYQADAFVRITGDCPLIDYKIVDKVIDCYLQSKVDYASNINPPTFPDGMDVEVFSFTALKKTWEEARSNPAREHVTLYMRESGEFKLGLVRADSDYSHLRWTVDQKEDFLVIKHIIENLYDENKYFDMNDILKYQNENPEFTTANQHIVRNEGLLKDLANDQK